ncbi:MAG TPA: HAD-IA family hydrolase [Gemmatimonadaceae bacterium]|nr:HAD-IA family hydrolase [Gemmatimonadaceae bacterium]
MSTAQPRPRPAILFDLDGTLIDTIELIVSSALHAFEGWPGAVPTEEEWIRGIGTPLVEQLRGYASDEADVAVLLERYRAYQHIHHDRLTRCYDGVPDVVARLAGRGYPMAIVTSKASYVAKQSLEWVRLASYFPVVIGYDETTRHKPDPEPVLVALERVGATANRAAFVGDSPHDIRAGNAAGVVTIAATWGPFSRETLAAARPNHFIECLADLPGVLDRAFGA